MKPHRPIAAFMTSLALAMAFPPAAHTTPANLNLDFAGLVGSSGAPGQDGWPDGQAISGRWTFRFDDDPRLDPLTHLPGERWSRGPGSLGDTLAERGGVSRHRERWKTTSPTFVYLLSEAMGPFQISPNLIVSFLGVEIGLSSAVDTAAEALQLDPLAWQMTLYTDL